MKLYTTLKRIKERNSIHVQMEALYSVIGEDYPKDKKIYLVSLLKAGMKFDDLFWLLKSVPEEQSPHVRAILTLFAADCAEQASYYAKKCASLTAWAAENGNTFDTIICTEITANIATRVEGTRDIDVAKRTWQLDRLAQYLNGKVDFMRAEGGDSGDLS